MLLNELRRRQTKAPEMAGQLQARQTVGKGKYHPDGELTAQGPDRQETSALVTDPGAGPD